MVVAQQHVRLPPRPPREQRGKRGSWLHHPFHHSLISSLCPLHSKTSQAPQITTAEGHRLFPSLVLGTRACRSREQPCPTQQGLAEQDLGWAGRG